MTDATKVYGACWLQDDSPTIYPHTLISVGMTKPLDVHATIVTMHIMMGEGRFVFRIAPERARRLAEHMLAIADQATELNGGVPFHAEDDTGYDRPEMPASS